MILKKRKIYIAGVVLVFLMICALCIVSIKKSDPNEYMPGLKIYRNNMDVK